MARTFTNRKGVLCPEHGIMPKPGSDPECRHCRLLLDLPPIRGQRGSISPSAFAARIARIKSGGHIEVNGIRCGGKTRWGAPCSRFTTQGRFCHAHLVAKMLGNVEGALEARQDLQPVLSGVVNV